MNLTAHFWNRILYLCRFSIKFEAWSEKEYLFEYWRIHAP
jgi:hypothetical protein